MSARRTMLQDRWKIGFWARLSFSPAKRQYAIVAHAEMMKPFSFQDLKKSRHESGARPEPCTVEGEAFEEPADLHVESADGTVFQDRARAHGRAC